jgi:hypothetical protein
MLDSWSGSITVQELNRVLRPGQAHLARYVDVLAYLRVGAPDAWPINADLRAIAKVDLQARDRTLCVEVADSGVPMIPGDVHEADATMWLRGMSRTFGMFARSWGGGLDEALEHAIAAGTVTCSVTRNDEGGG